MLLIQHRGGGVTYFRPSTGFSVNESQFPNVTVLWRSCGKWWPFVYVAFSWRFRFTLDIRGFHWCGEHA